MSMERPNAETEARDADLAALRRLLIDRRAGGFVTVKPVGGLTIDEGPTPGDDRPMADDGFRVDLDDALAERLRRFATAAGTPVAAVVRDAIIDYMDDWAETLSRLSDYDQTGVAVDAEAVLGRFEAAVAARVARS